MKSALAKSKILVDTQQLIDAFKELWREAINKR